MSNLKKNGSFHASLGNAFAGLIFLFRTQRNFRIHLVATVLVVLAGIWLKLSLIHWVFIVFAVGLVWISEAFNTALECFFDLIEPQENRLVKAGKDTAAAAVLIASILSAVIGILVIGPILVQRISLYITAR